MLHHWLTVTCLYHLREGKGKMKNEILTKAALWRGTDEIAREMQVVRSRREVSKREKRK